MTTPKELTAAWIEAVGSHLGSLAAALRMPREQMLEGEVSPEDLVAFMDRLVSAARRQRKASDDLAQAVDRLPWGEDAEIADALRVGGTLHFSPELISLRNMRDRYRTETSE